MAGMHIGSFWKYDATCSSGLLRGTKYENYARKSFDFVRQSDFNMYCAEMLRGQRKEHGSLTSIPL